MKVALFSVVGLAASATAQLSGKVGPTTTRDAKAAKKVCSILDYGGVASATTDNSAALTKAWDACKSGGQVFIPSGSYGLGKWVELSDGKGVSINLEGTIFRISSGTADGTLIVVQSTDDFEFYSGNSKGAIQGYGYEFHKDGKLGPNILRLVKTTSFSIHDLALVDAPATHLALDTCTNGEVYNLIIHGGDRGGLDGINVWSRNIWIHDVEVSNRAECVTVKSPSRNLLIESIFCNLSGGSSIAGGVDTSIEFVTYQNVYSQRCNQMMALRSNGGSGSVLDATFRNFTGHSNNYTIDINAFWTSKAAEPGDGVEYYGLTFSNWAGTTVDGTQFPPIQMNCPVATPCGSVEIENFNVWNEKGTSQVYKCQNAYGIGACMNQFAGNGAYSSTITVATMDPAKYTVAPMPREITKGLGITTSIDIPPVPTVFYPGRVPVSTLLAKPA